MPQQQRPSIQHLFWKEGLPVGGYVGALAMVSGPLQRYKWFSEISNLYVWTAIWFAVLLASLRLLPSRGPLYVAAHGWYRNAYMLWDLYNIVGFERPCVQVVEIGDVVTAGLFTAVAGGASFYCATRLCRPIESGTGVDDEVVGPEKA